MFTFYPTVSRGELGKYLVTPRIMLVASSFAAEEVRKHGLVRGKLPLPTLPDCVNERAADCGGFVSTFKWRSYRYNPEQYVEWLHSWHPQWAATMDYCCEPEVLGKTGIVRERQEHTTAMAYHFWQHYKVSPWAWVPTIQGWEVEDYQHHAEELKELIQEMQTFYGVNSFFRVGIGTLCKRASVPMIHQVIAVVSEVLPGIPFHLWGVKLGLLQSVVALPPSVVSMDSAAWNGMFRTGRNAWKQSGMSQRQYIHAIALPQYERKIDLALSQVKQASLF